MIEGKHSIFLGKTLKNVGKTPHKFLKNQKIEYEKTPLKRAYYQ